MIGMTRVVGFLKVAKVLSFYLRFPDGADHLPKIEGAQKLLTLAQRCFILIQVGYGCNVLILGSWRAFDLIKCVVKREITFAWHNAVPWKILGFGSRNSRGTISRNGLPIRCKMQVVLSSGFRH